MFRSLKEDGCLENLPSVDTFTEVRKTDGMGRGVFALRKLELGELLGIYPGRLIDEKEFLEKQEFVGRSVKYSYALEGKKVLDPTDIFGYLPDKPEARLALINEPPPGKRVSVIPLISKNHVWYIVINPTEVGEQIFTTYGPKYERDYETDLIGLLGIPKLSLEGAAALKNAAKKYTWLKKSIKLILLQHEKQ